jgi:acetyl esterase/lipase
MLIAFLSLSALAGGHARRIVQEKVILDVLAEHPHYGETTVPTNRAKCLELANSIEKIGDHTVKGFCEQRVEDDGDYIWDLMDPPLPASLVSSKTVNGTASWSVQWAGFTTESEPTPDALNTTFGKAVWWWPANMSAEAEQNRVLFVHGCDSGCDVSADYYSVLTDRLAHHLQMPVLGVNYATEPEYPWPDNVKSVISSINFISQNGPSGPSPLKNLFIVADSEGGLVALHTMIALVDHFGILLGVPTALRAVGTPMGKLPLAGMMLSSPTVDVTCTGASMFTNCWEDRGERHDTSTQKPSGSDATSSQPAAEDVHVGEYDITTKGNCEEKLTSNEERVNDCKWSYLNYFFGIEWGSRTHNNTQAHDHYLEHPAEFWTSPTANPLMFDYSAPGTPPILVIMGSADYFASDGKNLTRRICETGGEVEHFMPRGMWHDFLEYSEGCSNPDGTPLAEGIEAYKRMASFAHRQIASRSSKPTDTAVTTTGQLGSNAVRAANMLVISAGVVTFAAMWFAD